jgi:hypothetical protein
MHYYCNVSYTLPQVSKLLQWQSYTLSQVSTTGPVAVIYFVSGFHNWFSGSHILCLRFPQLVQWQSYTLSQVSTTGPVAVIYYSVSSFHNWSSGSHILCLKYTQLVEWQSKFIVSFPPPIKLTAMI